MLSWHASPGMTVSVMLTAAYASACGREELAVDNRLFKQMGGPMNDAHPVHRVQRGERLDRAKHPAPGHGSDHDRSTYDVASPSNAALSLRTLLTAFEMGVATIASAG